MGPALLGLQIPRMTSGALKRFLTESYWAHSLILTYNTLAWKNPSSSCLFSLPSPGIHSSLVASSVLGWLTLCWHLTALLHIEFLKNTHWLANWKNSYFLSTNNSPLPASTQRTKPVSSLQIPWKRVRHHKLWLCGFRICIWSLPISLAEASLLAWDVRKITFRLHQRRAGSNLTPTISTKSCKGWINTLAIQHEDLPSTDVKKKKKGKHCAVHTCHPSTVGCGDRRTAWTWWLPV